MHLRSLLLSLAWLFAASLHAELPELIQQAGNTDNDRERQALLEKMAALPSLDDTQRKEAVSLADFARRWNESGLKFYGASVRGKPHRAIGDYDFGVAKDSPTGLTASSSPIERRKLKKLLAALVFVCAVAVYVRLPVYASWSSRRCPGRARRVLRDGLLAGLVVGLVPLILPFTHGPQEANQSATHRKQA